MWLLRENLGQSPENKLNIKKNTEVHGKCARKPLFLKLCFLNLLLVIWSYSQKILKLSPINNKSPKPERLKWDEAQDGFALCNLWINPLSNISLFWPLPGSCGRNSNPTSIPIFLWIAEDVCCFTEDWRGTVWPVHERSTRNSVQFMQTRNWYRCGEGHLYSLWT